MLFCPKAFFFGVVCFVCVCVSFFFVFFCLFFCGASKQSGGKRRRRRRPKRRVYVIWHTLDVSRAGATFRKKEPHFCCLVTKMALKKNFALPIKMCFSTKERHNNKYKEEDDDYPKGLDKNAWHEIRAQKKSSIALALALETSSSSFRRRRRRQRQRRRRQRRRRQRNARSWGEGSSLSEETFSFTGTLCFRRRSGRSWRRHTIIIRPSSGGSSTKTLIMITSKRRRPHRRRAGRAGRAQEGTGSGAVHAMCRALC